MKVLQMDPRTPLRLKPEHEATIDRQVNEALEVELKKLLTENPPTSRVAEYADAFRKSIKAKAVAVLQGLHNEKTKGRLAHWLTTCRLDGCEKKPRSGKGHKSTFVFCKDHAGVKNQISKDDYRRLKANATLRVVA